MPPKHHGSIVDEQKSQYLLSPESAQLRATFLAPPERLQRVLAPVRATFLAPPERLQRVLAPVQHLPDPLDTITPARNVSQNVTHITHNPVPNVHSRQGFVRQPGGPVSGGVVWLSISTSF